MAWYEVDSITINTGSIAWGDLARTYTDDSNRLGLNEVVGDPGFDYEFVFESIPVTVTQFRFKFNGYYQGNPAHVVKVYAYNYHLAIWSEIGTLVSDVSDQTFEWSTLDAADWSDSGQAKIQFYHVSPGAVGHYLRIDQLIIEDMTPTTAPPTTVPPTTLGPLTTSTPSSPIPPTTPVPVTTLAPTTVVPTTLLTTAPPTTPFPHDPLEDVIFNCLANNYAGVLVVDMSITGESQSNGYEMNDLELNVEMVITGEVPLSGHYALEDFELTVDMTISGTATAGAEKSNWVGWSKIGSASFELDLTNDAGFRPMSWKGYVYRVMQLDKNVVIYGSRGVTVAFPVSSPAPTFGFKDVLNIGIKNKTAIAGDQFVHYFIDVTGCLYKLSSEGLNSLGFEEFLSGMINPTLLWDATDSRLHISDINKGYIYNEQVLTGGYANLTGLYRLKDNLTLVSPDTVIATPVYIVTDIIDFNRRGLKSIENVEVDTISEVPLFVAIDYRYKKTEEFKTTGWTQVNNEGVAHIRVSAVEFRIRLKGLDHGTFKWSYLNIHYKYVDQRFTRDQRFEPQFKL